ncbi:MAG: hypothetical protein EOO27_18300 [Comamonadaceae bacterium]|nr:MAG: hypothetical protein EOO27_18300 [Comamonadaceae bacterium]
MNSPLYFPLVGAAGTTQSDARDYDKRWLIADEEGNWLSVDQCPTLSTITVELKLGYLVLRAPGMLRMDIPLDVIEDDDSVRFTVKLGAAQSVDVVDEGELAAAWLSNVTGKTCGLMKVHPDAGPVQWPGN